MIRNAHVVAASVCALGLLSLTWLRTTPIKHLFAQSSSGTRFEHAGTVPSATSATDASLDTSLASQPTVTPSHLIQQSTQGFQIASDPVPTSNDNAVGEPEMHGAVLSPDWRPLQVDWQDTPLGPGYPAIVHSAWSDTGTLRAGHVLRVEADGFNGQDHPNAGWGWYLNVWSGDGRHWNTKPDASRLLHLNPRPRGGIVAMNHCLKGSWGPERDVPVPRAWQLENAATPFVLELELGDLAWIMKLNGDLQSEMTYDRQGDYSGPLIVQLYDVLNPRLALMSRDHAVPDPNWKQGQVDWQDTPLGPGYPTIVHSAWSDIGVLTAGSTVRIEADGFNGQDGPIAGWGWYLNVWSGDGRHWNTKNNAFRLLHLNPRPRGGTVAMNHCLKTGWGKQRDVPVPKAWRLTMAATAFVLELELGNHAWSMKLNGELQPKLAYDRKGDFSGSCDATHSCAISGNVVETTL